MSFKQGWHLFEGGIYLKEYSMCQNQGSSVWSVVDAGPRTCTQFGVCSDGNTVYK